MRTFRGYETHLVSLGLPCSIAELEVIGKVFNYAAFRAEKDGSICIPRVMDPRQYWKSVSHFYGADQRWTHKV
jgi:hypothetical protein